MPTSRRTTSVEDDAPVDVLDIPDAVPDGSLDPRDSALQSLLAEPAQMLDADTPVVTRQRILPELTGVTVNYTGEDGGGIKLLVWADVYERLTGDKPDGLRVAGRRGDIACVPDNALTQSQIELGHLMPLPE